MNPQPPPPSSPHFLIVALPAQSHINPALQLALRLLHSNLAGLVTLATTISASTRFNTTSHTTTSYPSGLRFATFSDGHDDPTVQNPRSLGRNGESYLSGLRRRGAETLSDLIERTHSPKFDFAVYTFLLPFAADVARRHRLPFAVLWVQPAAALHLFRCYFTGYADAIHGAFRSSPSPSPLPAADSHHQPSPPSSVELPGLPPLSSDDIPALFSPSSPMHFAAVAVLREIFDEMEREPDSDSDSSNNASGRTTILVNTFEALEADTLKALCASANKFKVRPVGPLLPPLHDDDDDNNNTDLSFQQLDLFERSEEDDYLKWLDTNGESSVVYVSFGSISFLSSRTVHELAAGLVETNRPFLWVVKDGDNRQGGGDVVVGEEDGDITAATRWLDDRIREGKENGLAMVVPWCNQVEVLSHRAVGCFVTHCGWNSSLESLGCGVPVVAVPLWVDQLTNAKLLEGVWKVGVRAAVWCRGGDDNGDGDEKVASVVVGREEITRCVEMVMESDEIRRNVARWKELAGQAVGEGGSSDTNLREFVEQVVIGRR